MVAASLLFARVIAAGSSAVLAAEPSWRLLQRRQRIEGRAGLLLSCHLSFKNSVILGGARHDREG